MTEMVMIERRLFDLKLKEITSKLELEALRAIRNTPTKWADIEELHGTMHLYVCRGFDELRGL